MFYKKDKEDIIRPSNIPCDVKRKIVHIRDKREYRWSMYKYADKVIVECGDDLLSLCDGDDNTLIERMIIEKDLCFHISGENEYYLLEKYESKLNGQVAYIVTVLDRRYLILQKEYA